MAYDLEIIKQLENELDIELRPIEFKNISNFFSPNGYALDPIKKKEVIGLHLMSMGLKDFPLQILELKSLHSLRMDDNLLSRLPKEISRLRFLEKLDLNENNLNELPREIAELQSLKKLYLINNNITILPKEITELNMEIKWEYDEKGGIVLKGNPLKSPPIEIVKQGRDAVLNYFKELETESVRLLQSKLLIVGNGEVGKTTLMKKLENLDFQVEVGKEKSTHGINIVPWELECDFSDGDCEKIKIHFWDFGGQDIYHTTHQFFLTKRSLYLFVWEARKEEESRSFDYWLNVIKLLSNESPVIVVMNKADERKKHIDEIGFKKKFENIVDFLQVSCVDFTGIVPLTNQIRATLAGMDHLKDKLPKVWLDVRDKLKSVKKDFISLQDYFKICLESELEEDRAEYLSDYLHDLGVILHYRHDPLLENTVILNPEWATEAVYKLIDTTEIFDNRGRFNTSDLKKYWDLEKFPRDKHPQLIRLMEKFEICFTNPDTGIHIVPELLPTALPPINFDKYIGSDNLHFEYHYDFMPEGILTRFISRMYFLIENEHFWKYGVELKFENSTALVMSEPLDRKIKIAVRGPRKNELLAITRNDLEYIHKTINMELGKHYNEMIPCICSQCRESDDPYLFQYKVLIRRKSKSGFKNYCQNSDEEVPIDKLLTGFEPPEPKKALLDRIITTVHHLQGIAKTIKSDEDSRNGFIALILSIHGYIVKDQTRWGRSASGKSAGEVDIKVEFPDLEAQSIIEAFNLKTLSRDVIDKHLIKLFGYDPNGLKDNVIIVYSESDDFSGLWQKYIRHIPEINFKHKLIGKPKEQKTRFTDIKMAVAKHKRQGQEIKVHHIFVNMNI